MTVRAEPRRRLAAAWNGLAAAATLLTIVPVPFLRAAEPAATAAWFPAVGALAGLLAGAVRVALLPVLGRGPASVLALATLVAVTGALHQDGLADTFDGLGARGCAERRLAVMRDSATGAFGVLALVGWALLAYTALAPLGLLAGLRALTIAAAAGRWAALVHALAAPPARSDGLGAGLSVTPVAFAIATALAAAVALPVAGPGRGAVALACAAGAGLLVAGYARRWLRGRTGDTLGASVALAEAAVLVALGAFWAP